MRRSVATLAIIAVSLAACTVTIPGAATSRSTTSAREDASNYGGTFTIQLASAERLDPTSCFDDSSFRVISNIYSLLFRQDAIGEPFPDLATAWTYENGMMITFYLRRGVMWQDGNEVFPKGHSREVVADDVVYSIKRVVESQSSCSLADLKSSYQSVESLDRYTVRLTLTAPDALLFSPGRGLSGVAIVPHEAVEKLGADPATHPIGSGPFKLLQYKPGDSIVLVRNDLYWKKPYIDKVIFRIVSDPDVAVAALESEKVDTLSTLPGAQVERLGADKRLVIGSTGCPAGYQLMFNMTDPLFADVRFRQAIAFALDAPEIAASVFGRGRVEGCGTAGPGVAGYDSELCGKYFGRDPETAAALLAQLGYVRGPSGILERDGRALAFPIEVSSDPPMPQIGAAIVSQLREVGLQAELQTVGSGAFFSDWNNGADKAMLAGGWCGEGGLIGLWGRLGMARSLGYDDPDLFDLLDKAAATIDWGSRDAILRQATDRIYAQYWSVPIGFKISYVASGSWIHDYRFPLWSENICTERNNVWTEK